MRTNIFTKNFEKEREKAKGNMETQVEEEVPKNCLDKFDKVT